MGKNPQFSERQFEQALNLELLAHASPRLFSVPSQVAEKDVGYDVALVPALPVIWALLGRPRPAPGLKVGRGGEEPAFAASLFIQYKRPEELKRRNAREAEARKIFCEGRELPYFRYGLPSNQLDTLIELSRVVGADAEVCYAAPAFTSLAELHDFQMRHAVVRGTDFLPLPEIDAFLGTHSEWAPQSNARRHVWTYRSAGSDGVLCSEPSRLRSLSGRDFYGDGLGFLFRNDSLLQPLLPHIFQLEEGVAAWEAGTAKIDRRRWGPDLENFGRQRLLQAPPGVRAALNIQNAIGRHHIGWILLLGWSSD